MSCKQKIACVKSVLGIFFLLVVLGGCSPRVSEVELVPQVCMQAPPFVVIDAPQHMVKPDYRRVIMIDPGHGGQDFGTQSLVKPIYTEKNLNLTTARMLQDYLKQMGYETYMTRYDDTFISLDKRAQLANDKNVDLFVSVHYNAAPNAKAEGIEVFYYRIDKSQDRVQTSKILADSVLTHLIEATHAKSRGVKHGNLAVIRKTNMPAILVEGGFLTSESELAKLKDPAYLKTVAWGIAQGVHAYVQASSQE